MDDEREAARELVVLAGDRHRHRSDVPAIGQLAQRGVVRRPVPPLHQRNRRLEALARRVTRVCLTGPECTGKTTLARRLAEHFGTLWVPEFAREYALGVARPLTLTDVDLIARGQMAGEDLTLLDADRLLFLDTDLVSTVVYSNYYYSAVPQWVTAEARRRLADLYLLADIDIPFELDP